MLVSTLLLATAVVAAPSAGYPFNSQLPPVARWGQNYAYTLPRDTCTGDGEISYSADNLPSWLSFDGNNFSGTPNGGSSDETVFFQLKCKDASGQETSSESKLIISSAQPPKLNPDNTLVKQLAKFGPTDGGSGLVVKPNEHWSVSFEKDTFVKTDRDIEGYYGIMRNHTPLPIWMSFSPGDTNTFAGQSPAINSQIAPAQAFAVEFVASDYAGFSAVSQTFSLVVGAHQLTTEEGSISLDAKRGEAVDGQLPLDKVILDGSPIGDQLGSIQLNIDGWLKVDNNGKLSGTPDDNATSGPVSATIYDKYGDAVAIVINVNIDGAPLSVTSSSESKTESDESKTESDHSKTESGESNSKTESHSDSKTDSDSSATTTNSDSSKTSSSSSDASATSSGATKTSSGASKTSSTASSTSSSTSSSAHPIFATQIPDVNATQGGWFSFTIPQDAFHLSRKRAVLVKRVATLSASYNPASAGDFIHFNPSNMTFSGEIPDDFGGADVTVTAVDGDKSDTMTFHINGTKKSDVNTSSSSSSASSSSTATSSASSTASSTEPTDSASSTSSGTPVPVKTTNKSNTTAVAVGCGVGIPIGLIALALLVFCCWRRKRHNKASNGDDFEKANISRPMPSNEHHQDLEDMYLAPEKTRVSPLTPSKSPNGGPGGMGAAAGVAAPMMMMDKGKEVDEDWDTPKRLSAMNFFKVDQYDSDDASMYSSERTHVDREIEGEQHNNAGIVPEMPNVDSEYYNQPHGVGAAGLSEGAAAAGAAAAAGVQQPAQTVQPRKSWRQTIDSTRRWQDRQSMASLATVSTDELFSVRLVDDEDEQQQYSQHDQQQHHLEAPHSPIGLAARRNTDSEFMNPTQSMILTPRQSVLDDDSPNYHHIGTNSTGQHSGHSGHSAQHSIGSISSEDEPYTAQQFVSNSRPNSSLKINSNLASVTEESPNLHKHLTPNIEAANEYTPTLSGTPDTFTNSPPPPIPAVNANRPSPSSLRSQLEPPNQQFDFEDNEEEYNTPEVEWKGDSSNLVPGWNNHDDDTSSDDDRYHRYHDSVSEPHYEHEMNPSPKLVNFTNSGRASSSDSPMSSSRDMENSQSVSAELAFI